MSECDFEVACVALIRAVTALRTEPTLQRVLGRVVSLAADVIPAVEHASVTVVGASRLGTAAATGDFPERVDAIQHELGEGPCVEAVRAGRVVVVCLVPRVRRLSRRCGGAGCLARPRVPGAAVRFSPGSEPSRSWQDFQTGPPVYPQKLTPDDSVRHMKTAGVESSMPSWRRVTIGIGGGR